MNLKLHLGYFVFAILLTSTSQSFAGPGDLPNFRVVKDGLIFRGGQPTAEGLRELAVSGIHTILSIRNESPGQIAAERKFIEQDLKSYKIHFISVPMSAYFTPNDGDIDFIENKVLGNPENFPVFVHCLHGEDRTGLVIGLYRVFIQMPGISPRDAYSEMINLGFHPILRNLAKYFYAKTNWRPSY